MVVVETTGVGQSEIDIVHVADTVVLVIQPGSGDVLQFLKAGIMEIPDMLVVNKADHDELARRAVADLQWRPAHRARGGAAGGRTAGLGDPDRCDQRNERHGNRRAESMRSTRTGSSSETELAARRRQGEVHWALDLFSRKHGEHGVSALGGNTTLRARAER